MHGADSAPLGPDELGELAGQTEIEFHLAGAAILTEPSGRVPPWARVTWRRAYPE